MKRPPESVESVKVEENAFKDAIRALLNTPPTTAKTILKPSSSAKKPAQKLHTK